MAEEVSPKQHSLEPVSQTAEERSSPLLGDASDLPHAQSLTLKEHIQTLAGHLDKCNEAGAIGAAEALFKQYPDITRKQLALHLKEANTPMGQKLADQIEFERAGSDWTRWAVTYSPSVTAKVKTLIDRRIAPSASKLAKEFSDTRLNEVQNMIVKILEPFSQVRSVALPVSFLLRDSKKLAQHLGCQVLENPADFKKKTVRWDLAESYHGLLPKLVALKNDPASKSEQLAAELHPEELDNLEILIQAVYAAQGSSVVNPALLWNRLVRSHDSTVDGCCVDLLREITAARKIKAEQTKLLQKAMNSTKAEAVTAAITALKKGADPDSEHDSKALYMAMQIRNYELVRLCAKQTRTWENSNDLSGWMKTIMTKWPTPEIASLLKSLTPKNRDHILGFDSDGASALAWAVSLGDSDKVSLLMDLGIDINQICFQQNQDYLKHGYQETGQERKTALWMAIESGNTKMIQFLLSQGADPNKAVTIVQKTGKNSKDILSETPLKLLSGLTESLEQSTVKEIETLLKAKGAT